MPGGANSEYAFTGTAQDTALSLRIFHGPVEGGQEVFAQGLSGANSRQVAHAMAAAARAMVVNCCRRASMANA